MLELLFAHQLRIRVGCCLVRGRHVKAANTCLSVVGADPPATVLGRIEATGRRVSARSRCAQFRRDDDEVEHESAEACAVFHGLGEFQSDAPDTLVVEGSVHGGVLCGEGYRYELRRDEGVWRIVKSEGTWMSQAWPGVEHRIRATLAAGQ